MADVQRADEEALREEHGRLRALVVELRGESQEVKEKIKTAENVSIRKDRLLQEFLATTKGGNAVPGEMLDQAREDLQGLLQFKRQAQEARQVLDEREQKIASLKQELRATRVLEMEEDVAAAKMEAKAKANEWMEANSDCKDTQCFTVSRQRQQEAKEILRETIVAENEASDTQRRFLALLDERARLQQGVRDHTDQIEQLEGKRAEIEGQTEQCVERISSLGEITKTHKRLQLACQERCEQVTRLQRNGFASPLTATAETPPPGGAAAAHMVGQWLLSTDGGGGGRPPAPQEDEGLESTGALLWGIRQTLETSRRSGLELLAAEDVDGDGCVTATELATAVKRLGLPTTMVHRLVHALPLVEQKGLVPIVDLVLALPLQPPPIGAPPDAELYACGEALAWACRRRRTSEAELRSRLAGWFADPASDLLAEAIRVCTEYDVQGDRVASKLGLGLVIHREGFSRFIPPWRSASQESDSAVLLRFVRDVAAVSDIVVPILTSVGVGVEATMAWGVPLRLSEAGAHLGHPWSQEDLEVVALLAEVGSPPVVDCQRLAHASLPDGFASQFPEALQHLQHFRPDALAACEAAAAAPPRRNTGSRGIEHVPTVMEQPVPNTSRGMGITSGTDNLAVTESSSRQPSPRVSHAGVGDIDGCDGNEEIYEEDYEDEDYEDESDGDGSVSSP